MAQDVGQAASMGDPVATEAVLRAAKMVGQTTANLVNFANPGTVVRHCYRDAHVPLGQGFVAA